MLVYHYGRLRNDNLYSENDRIIRLWKQVIQSLRAYPTNQLVYELYNEPTTDMDVWKSAANTLVRELRKEDPDRIFIIGGANYNGI
ncbi:cellulase family glycosylhydrolase, partial [Acinetobacter baumannii]